MNLSRGERVGQVVIMALLVLLCLTIVMPFWYFLVLSFNDALDSMRGGVYVWPRQFTLLNYRTAFEDPNILTAYKWSILRTAIGTVLSIVLTSMAAYALQLKRLPGKGAVVFAMFFTTIFSGGIIPLYILLRQLGLINNPMVYVLPQLYAFFYIVIVRTFFNTIPDSLREAAIIDGARLESIYLRIYLPLSKPVLATVGLFIAVGHWNDWFSGSFFVTRRELWPTATLLQQMLQETGFASNTLQQMGQINAAQEALRGEIVTPDSLRVTFLIITTLPIIVIYPFIQKYFVKGVMIGSIKG